MYTPTFWGLCPSLAGIEDHEDQENQSTLLMPARGNGAKLRRETGSDNYAWGLGQEEFALTG
jgi:hypothetical protein